MDKVRLKSIIDYIIKYALTGSVRECVGSLDHFLV